MLNQVQKPPKAKSFLFMQISCRVLISQQMLCGKEKAEVGVEWVIMLENSIICSIVALVSKSYYKKFVCDGGKGWRQPGGSIRFWN